MIFTNNKCLNWTNINKPKYISGKIFFIIMEEKEQQNENNNELEGRKISINASEIIKKFKAAKDRQLFCREMSKINLYKL